MIYTKQSTPLVRAAVIGLNISLMIYWYIIALDGVFHAPVSNTVYHDVQPMIIVGFFLREKFYSSYCVYAGQKRIITMLFT